MNILTTDRVNVTAVTIESEATLEELSTALTDLKYDASIPTVGWGSLLLSTDVPLQSRSAAGSTTVTSDIYASTPLLLARFLYDRTIPGVAATLPEGLTENEENLRLYSLTGVDVVMRTVEPSHHQAFISSHKAQEVKRVTANLRHALDSAGFSDCVVTDLDESLTPVDDLFLWLLNKSTDGQVTSDMALKEIREMHSHDGDLRRTRISDRVDTQREEAALRARDALSAFGPAKFMVSDKQTKLDVDLELKADGRFSIFVGSSAYFDPNHELNTPRGRVEAVLDVATRVLPRLYRAHSRDTDWAATGRVKFRQTAIDTLAAALKGQIKCGKCGHVY